MSQFFLLLKLKFNILIKGFIRLTKIQKVIAVIFFLVILFFILGDYGIFYAVFQYLKLQPIIGKPLTWHSLDLIFLAFFFLLIVSNIITAIPTLLKSKEIPHLLDKPVSHLTIFSYKFFENIIYSSWAILILGFPVLVAFGTIYQVAWYFYPVIILALVPFVVASSAIGILITLLAARFLSKFSGKQIFMGIVVITAGIFYFFLRFSFPSMKFLTNIESISALNRFIASLNFTSPYFPSSWLIELAKSLSEKNASNSIFYILLLLSTALAFGQICLLLANATYYKVWNISQEGREIRHQKSKYEIPSAFWRQLFPGVFGALVLKDIRLFFRNAIELSQTLFLAMLLAFYLFILGVVPMFNPNSSFLATIVTYINFGITGYMLATFAMRFTFPAISLEGQNSWIIWSSPMKNTKVFWEKFWSNLILFFIITQSLTLASAWILKLDSFVLVISLVINLLMNISLVSLTLGFGALFPNFREKNPSRLASSSAGVITILLALVYVAAVIIFLATPLESHFKARLSEGVFQNWTLFYALGGILGVSFLATFLPLFFGIRRLRKYDF